MDARLAAYVARLPRPGGDDALAAAAPIALPFREQLRALGLRGRCAALLAAHAVETVVVIAGWAFVGAGALSGRLDSGWLLAWALCLTSIVPLRAASQWLEGVVSVGIGGLLRERLLSGAMAIDGEYIRRRGSGELLGEVLEIEQIERLGAAGGIAAALAALELLAALIVFTWGAGAATQLAVLLAWTAITLGALAHNTRRRAAWTESRFEITHRLVENMSAHRTRAVQQRESARHRQEDGDHARYAERARQLDRSSVIIHAALERAYVIVALIALAPSLLAGDATIAQLAIALGGILFAAAALRKLGLGFASAAAAWIAWQRMKPLFAAPQPEGESRVAGVPATASTVLMAKEILFRHAGRIEPVLKGCSLTLRRGDCVLLEGGSGSGKSTLAALLAGLRQPHGGVLLAGGLDRQTLGVGWRRHVALAPQYHENHILAAPLGFNLLLGRPLPHSREDLEEARAVCEELGLGPLLARMPSGLDQMVGETGWQLSQGERSRVFLARALLQDAQLVVLDESLAALDPENLSRCVECVMRRAKTVLVIAHP